MPLSKIPNGNSVQESPIDVLTDLRDRFGTERQGHREKVLQLVCDAFVQFLAIKKSPLQKKAFYDAAGVKKAKRQKRALDAEVMAFLAGAKSNAQRKLAWKRARAVSYLHEQGVKNADLAAEIRERGGIEKVARLAAKHTPRKPKAPNSSQLPVAKDAAAKLDPEVEATVAAKVNDQHTLLKVSIKMSDLDELRNMPVGKKTRLIAKRLKDVDSSRCLIRILSVK